MDKYKIFIDTDITDDIDDLWALLLALNVKNIDVIGISVCNGYTPDKARFLAKVLSELNLNIPIYIGESVNIEKNVHLDYIGEYTLEDYKGNIYEGFDQINQHLKKDDDITLVALGPQTNISKMISLYPYISNYKLVLMGGAFFKGYINQKVVAEEFNVVIDIESFKRISKSFNDLIIAPLDVCRDIIIKDQYYEEILKSKKQSIKILIENYYIWNQTYKGGSIKYNPKTSSTILYDLIPIMYLIDQSLFISKTIAFNVLDSGVIKPNAFGDYKAQVLLEVTNRDKLYKTINKFLLEGDLI